MMRQVWITRHGGPEVLAVRESPVPRPAAGEALVEVAAAGINFADIMARRGVYPDAPKPPCVVGYEIAGEVISLGPGVDHCRIGERVIALTRFGGYSSHVAVPAAQIFPLPASFDYAQGAALPVTYLTAYQLVIAMGRARAGETILLHSAGGGVGHSVIELARIIGAEVIGIASAAKHESLRRRGLTRLVDTRHEDLVARVMALTDGRGVDLALDPTGGASWRRSYDCLAPTGRLAAFGLAAAMAPRGGRWMPLLRTIFSVPWLRFNPLSLMNDNRGVFGVNIGHLWQEAALIRGWMENILQWQSEGKIVPTVDRAFPFAEAAAAHHHIEARQNIGKVVLVP